MLTVGKIIKENHYLIVHSHKSGASLALDAFVAKICGVPEVIGHSHNSQCNVSWKKTLWQHYIFKPFVNVFLDDRFACSEEAGKWLFGRRDDIKIINNAIDLHRFRFSENVRNEYRKDLGIEDKFVVGFVGRLDGQKNPIRLLEIFKAVFEKNQQAVLLMVGDGPMREELEKKAKELKIESAVIFLGNRADVPQLMMAMDTFTMTSFYEGMPVVVAEVQATGLRMVISENVPTPNLINQMKVLNLEDDNEKWARALLEKSNFDRKIGAKMVGDGGYDIEYQAKELQNFYINSVKQLIRV